MLPGFPIRLLVLFASLVFVAFSHQVLLYKFLSHQEPTQRLRSGGKRPRLEADTPELTPRTITHNLSDHRLATNLFSLSFP